MTDKEKAKAYDGLIERLKDLKFAYRFSSLSDTIEEKFPELKESGDEKIRKAIIEHFEGSHSSMYPYKGFTKEQIIDWLEKQGEQKPITHKYNVGATIYYNFFGETKSMVVANVVDIGNGNPMYEDTDGNAVFEKDIIEPKTADKVEPKFEIEEGKWYICISQFCNCIEGRVYKATSDSRIMDDFGTEYDMHSDAYKYFRLWTIQDAKDGDVLEIVDHGRLVVGIASYINKTTGKIDVICLLENNNFKVGVYYTLDTINPHPATKEQRDLLFQKMHDAGYEWDADRLELKKIEPKSAWTDEDDKQLNDIIELLPNLTNRHNWLKSLKDRVQPQNTWKPSDEMLEALYRVIPENVMEKSEDEMLLDKLYQGLKYGRVLSEK